MQISPDRDVAEFDKPHVSRAMFDMRYVINTLNNTNNFCAVIKITQKTEVNSLGIPAPSCYFDQIDFAFLKMA